MSNTAPIYRRVSSWFRRHLAPGSSPPVPPPSTSPQPDSIEDVLARELPWLREQMAWDVGGSMYRRDTPLTASLTGETFEMRMAYRRMLAEPTVKAAFLGKLGSVASLDLTVSAPEGEEDNPKAKQIAQFTQANLIGASGTAYELVWEIAHGGLIDGFSVSEKLWKIMETGRWRGRWFLDRLKAKDTQYLLLETDQYRNVVGIRNNRAGQSGIAFDPADYVIFSNLPFFGSPYGMSDFRASYRAVELIVSAIKLRSLMLSKFTGPFLKGTYTDPLNRQAMITTLRDARAMGYIAVLKGSEVEVLDLASKGTTDFQSSIDDLRKEVAIGMQGAFLQMLEGTSSGLRGNSKVQKETSEIFVWLLCVQITAVINRQLIPDIVRPNFGEAAPLPIAKLGAIDPSEIVADLAIDEALGRIGAPIGLKDLLKRAGRKMPIDAADTIRTSATAAPIAPAQPAATFAEDPPPDPGAKETALVGPEKTQAEQLLDQAQRDGTAVLGRITKAAVSRILGNGGEFSGQLFTDRELDEYAEALAATVAAADLLGRSNVRQRMGEDVATFAEPNATTNSDTFAAGMITPDKALEYFLGLSPTIGINRETFLPGVRRTAFSLAVSSEQSLTDRIQKVIANLMASGAGASQGGAAVEDVLHAAGVTPTNPQYAEMVFRTNAMNAMNEASQAEMDDPDVAEYFPVWEYLGIRDGRQGEDHEPQFGKYYPNTVRFEDVRGPRVFNCRCSFRMVDKWEWAELQAKGARMETSLPVWATN